MFRLTKQERDELVAIWHQFEKMKHSYVLPYAFTEHGVTMLASVLKSERAIKMSIIIVKTFVKLREIMSVHKEFVYKLKELERKIEKHDADIKDIFEAIRQLLLLCQQECLRSPQHQFLQVRIKNTPLYSTQHRNCFGFKGERALCGNPKLEKGLGFLVGGEFRSESAYLNFRVFAGGRIRKFSAQLSRVSARNCDERRPIRRKGYP
jgi:hypothetical protein